MINLPSVYLRIVCMNGRGERIRTSDPLVPNQVLYQAEPLPELFMNERSIGRGLVRFPA